MNYLYGDSTPSRLTSNFLEFLRDAMDFAVLVLEADARIKNGKARIKKLTDESRAEASRLDAFVKNVTKAIAETDKGPPTSATAQCAGRIIAMAAEAQRATNTSLQAKLVADSEEVAGEEAEARTRCYEALATLLAPHDPPDTAVVTHVTLLANGTYTAMMTGRAAFGLEWDCNLAMPDGNPWSTLVRVERFLAQLEIHAPQLTGWISKEVKVKAQRLERYVVTELIDDRRTVKLKLRVEPGQDVGFDFEVNLETQLCHAERTGPATEKGLGPFDVPAEEMKMLVELATKLRASIADLERAELTSAKVEGRDFNEQVTYVPFVEKLIATLAPIVHEISEHSLAPTELVLRRLLGNDRREEIFVTKATLREKYAGLGEPLRELFAPLRLEDARFTKASKATPPKADEKRAELSPSRPPPPPSKPAPPPQIPPAANLPPPAKPSKPKPPDVPVRPHQATAPGFPPPAEGLQELPPPAPLPPQNEVLTATLKKIVTLAKNGRTEEAYVEFGELFESEAFGSYRPDEQRRALRLMVNAPPTNKGPLTMQAHRAAIGWMRSLVEAEKDPADHEMLGITLLMLDEGPAAKEAFEIGLARERERDAESELAEALAERVRALS